MKIALTIAGSDPTGAAGLEADLRVFQCFGIHGMALATALTVQDSARVHEVAPIEIGLFRRRLEVLVADIRPDVLKLGMLATAAHVEVVAEIIEGPLADIPLVIDPVIRSSSGAELLESEGVRLLRERLLPRATAVCPNRMEAAVLVGREAGPEELAEALAALGPKLVVVTGGDADEDEPIARDVVHVGGETVSVDVARIQVDSPHGTGCTFASALAAQIVKGVALADATPRAKAWTHRAIAASAVAEGSKGRPLPRLDGANDDDG